APAPAMQTSASIRRRSISSRGLALRAGVARQVPAAAGKGLVTYDLPAGGRRVVAPDQIRDGQRPEDPHVGGKRPELRAGPHLRRETMADDELDPFPKLEAREPPASDASEDGGRRPVEPEIPGTAPRPVFEVLDEVRAFGGRQHPALEQRLTE